MDAEQLLAYLAQQPLLALAASAIFIVVLGSLVRPSMPTFGSFLRGIGNLGLVAALLLTVVQAARFTTSTDLALPQVGLKEIDLPKQAVEGRETHVPMGRDGHFWIDAMVDGTRRRFMVDTGATLTAVAPATAQSARLETQTLRPAVQLRTGNGTITADLVTIRELRFGNVVARDLDAVVVPGIGEINVIGMNLLSRLASWRMEDGTLILVPKDPQPAEGAI